MINIDLEKTIIQFIDNQYRPRWITLNQEWKDYLLQRWDDCNNIKESYLRIKNNIDEIPKCPICGNNCNFRGANWVYDITCGNQICQNKLRKIKGKQTKLERYGDENYNNVLKGKQTKLERYGDENYNNVLKTKQTKLERYGDEKYTNREKAEKTCLERYGVKNGGGSKQALEKIQKTCLERYGVKSSWEIDETKKKTKQTKLERYGDEKYTNREKAEKTCLKKYGKPNPFQAKEVQDKYKETMIKNHGVDHNWKIKDEHELTHTKEALEKKKQTSLMHYGVEHPHQSKFIQNKINLTKKKNNTFNKSKSEDESYSLLFKLYPDTLRQYRSELYPFNCDFYIPSLNLYIECNYNWTHCKHPYNSNDINDQKLLEKMKSKNTKYYQNAINTWTIRDVNKRNIAKQNNLNYIEFWNINELKEWLNKKEET